MLENSSNNNRKNSDTLWHYCSCAAFFSILEKGVIRINDITKSNDREELRLLLDSCSKKLTEKTSWTGRAFTIFLAFIKNLFEEDTLIKTYEEASDKISLDNETKKSFELITKDINKKIWSFSFSKKGDDLNMWRAYGDDGFGISIGFKKTYFDNLLKDLSEKHQICAKLFDVEYCSEAPSKNRDEFIDKVISIVKDSNLTEEEKNEKYSLLRNDFVMNAARYKNFCFKDEEEVRLVIFGEGIKVDNLIFEKFLEKNNKFISFLNLQIDFFEAIDFIYLGPKNPNNTSDVKRMLDFKLPNHSIDIIHSEIPYV